MAEHYQVAVIGGGPGGYVAAIRAAQLGLKTVCIDKRATLGGTCLNIGCIPSKTLLHATELYASCAKGDAKLGISSSTPQLDLKTLMQHKNEVVHQLVSNVGSLLKHHQITVLEGNASLTGPHAIDIKRDNQTVSIEADHVILATGSEPIALPFLPFDEKQIRSSTGALNISNIPKKMIIIGGGVIGVEMASIYNRLGSHTIVIEMLDSICPGMDHAIQRALLQSLKKQGIEFLLGTQVVTAVVQPNEVILTLNHKDQQLSNLSADLVLVAVGRRPYSQGLGLEKVGIACTKQGFVSIDAAWRTSQPHIFAIGDLVEGPMLAHKASAEGVAVAEIIAGKQASMNYQAVPNVIYTYPEAAAVGLTEKEAKNAGLNVKTGIAYLKGNPRARCMNETDGMIKLIGEEKTGRLVGMHLLAPHASELVAVGMLAIEKGATVAELAAAPFAHPTLSEALKEAALNLLGRPIHG